jgi:hypothetical protein
MATLAQLNDRRLLQQENTIRSMRSMTDLAVSSLDWSVRERTLDYLSFCLSLFPALFAASDLQFQRIDMTFTTKAYIASHRSFFWGEACGS